MDGSNTIVKQTVDWVRSAYPYLLIGLTIVAGLMLAGWVYTAYRNSVLRKELLGRNESRMVYQRSHSLKTPYPEDQLKSSSAKLLAEAVGT